MDPLRIALISIAVFSLLLCGCYYLYRGYKREKSNEKVLLYGMASLLILGLALTKFFQLLADFEINGYYINHDLYGDFYNHTPLYEVYGKLAIISTSLGAFFLFFCFELGFRKTKFIFTIISLIFTSITIYISLTSPIQSNYDFELITGTYFLIVFYFSIIWLTKYANLELKAISGALLFGYFLMVIGYSSLDGIPIKSELHIHYILVRL